MRIDELKILGGVGKNRQPDLVEEIVLKMVQKALESKQSK